MFANRLTKALPIVKPRKHRELWKLIDKNKLLEEKKKLQRKEKVVKFIY